MTAQQHYILIGVDPGTGNMGVSALFAATVKAIAHAQPTARISLLMGHRHRGTEPVRLADGRVIRVERVGVRENKTIWRRNHVLHLLAVALLGRLVPAGLGKRLFAAYPCLEALRRATMVADITGGDSFSDIYGLPRLLRGCLP